MTDMAFGIDIGTSGVRIAALSRDNQLIAMVEAPILAPITDGFHHLQDPALWWDATVKAFSALKIDGHRVRALAVDGTSGTILPIDESGTPTGLASMYNDVAEAAHLAMVASAAPPETAALGSTSPLARAIPHSSQGVRIIHQADWLQAQFSGRFDVTDENNALKSGYDPIARGWPSWIAKTGFDVTRFPEVVPAGSPIGTITAEAAQRFNLPRDVAIIAGTTDGCAAFLASGASEPGDGVTSLGTTLTLKLLSAKPVFAPQFGIYSHRIGDRWLAGGASNSGGAAIGKFFSKDDLMRLTPQLDPAHTTGLDYYPLPAPGERFPINDPALAAHLEPRPSDDAKFLQGILEGIARIEAQGYQRLAELGATRLASIRSVGGGSSNQAWSEIRLRLLGVPALPSLSEHAAVGAARLAWRGLTHAD
jgi:sugar (pentulose or hexulose) kinase